MCNHHLRNVKLSLFSCAVNPLNCFWNRGVEVNSYAINRSPVYQTGRLRCQKQAAPVNWSYEFGGAVNYLPICVTEGE